jgi:spore coat protein CotH
MTKMSFRRLRGSFGVRPVTQCAVLLVLVLAPGVRAQNPPMLAPPLPSAPLFNDTLVQRIDLWVHTEDWEKLKQNFRANDHYPADLIFNGQTVRYTGIRSRGLGSRSGTKPGLRVDFDYYVTDQTLLGLKSIVLDNLTQDPSAIHETAAMKVLARLGVPTPREAHVRLYVNNAYSGLYAVVESVDKQFLARVFGSIDTDVQNDGYLYEFNYVAPWTFTYLGPTLESYASRFDVKTHESKSMFDKYGPIENLVRLANTLGPDQFMAVLHEHLDLVAFVRYMAAQNFVGQNDGFLGYAGMNNFYFYRLENSPQHVFIAWDEDNAFWGPEYSIDMRHQENVLMSKAMQVPELSAAYDAALREAAALSEERAAGDTIGWLETEVRGQLDRVHDALAQDGSKPYTMDEHEVARGLMIRFARERSGSVLEQLRRR